MFSLLVTTSLVGEEPSHLWPAFPSDSLGFSQIPGHCVGTVLLSVVWSSAGLDNTKYGRIFNIILIRIIRNTWSSQV
jgi:hypothetical protein